MPLINHHPKHNHARKSDIKEPNPKLKVSLQPPSESGKDVHVSGSELPDGKLTYQANLPQKVSLAERSEAPWGRSPFVAHRPEPSIRTPFGPRPRQARLARQGLALWWMIPTRLAAGSDPPRSLRTKRFTLASLNAIERTNGRVLAVHI